MSDYRRVYVPGGRYFFTVVCWHRRPVFADPSAVELLRHAMRLVKKERPFAIDAMVVLPDHIHCMWRLPENDRDFSGRWREIKKRTTKQLTPSAGQVWQPRFWEHLLRDDEDWRRHMDYIHFNPVKHVLVRRPADWPYSSFSVAVRKGWYSPDWGGCPENVGETYGE